MESLEPAVVESHISRKTSEIWGTQALFPLLAFKNFPRHRTWVPHISLVFREMWDSTNVSRATLSKPRIERKEIADGNSP